MKPLYWVVVSLLLFTNPAISQTKKVVSKPPQKIINKAQEVKAKVGPLKEEDYDFYILLEQADETPNYSNNTSTPFKCTKSIVDIRTGKILEMCWPDGSNYFSKSLSKIINTEAKWPLVDAGFRVFSKDGLHNYYVDNGLVVGNQNVGGTFSPDFKSFIYLKENDYWITKVNFNTGKLEPATQLTRFGFRSAVPDKVWSWYNDAICVGGRFFLNAKTGDVQDLQRRGLNFGENMFKYPEITFSADHRFVMNHPSFPSSAITSRRVYDVLLNKSILIDSSNSDNIGISSYTYVYWLKNRQLISIDQYNRKISSHTFFDDGTFVTKELPLTIVPNKQIDQFDWRVGTIPFDLTSVFNTYGRRCFAPDTSKYLVNNNTGWYILSPVSGVIEKQEFGWNYISWVDNDHFIFCAGGSAANQGTYIRDIKEKKSKKLFSYTIERAYDMNEGKSLYNEKSNYLIFGANHTLWRCRPDGSELTELIKDLKSDLYVKPFLSKTLN